MPITKTKLQLKCWVHICRGQEAFAKNLLDERAGSCNLSLESPEILPGVLGMTLLIETKGEKEHLQDYLTELDEICRLHDWRWQRPIWPNVVRELPVR